MGTVSVCFRMTAVLTETISPNAWDVICSHSLTASFPLSCMAFIAVDIGVFVVIFVEREYGKQSRDKFDN